LCIFPPQSPSKFKDIDGERSVVPNGCSEAVSKLAPVAVKSSLTIGFTGKIPAASARDPRDHVAFWSATKRERSQRMSVGLR
jgi:hypothetical protein